MLKPKTIYFKDYPEFQPNITPKQMFKMGVFGGTYWRPIYSGVTKKNYKNEYKKYPKSWFTGISEDKLSNRECDKKKNKYKVKVGTSLKFWEKKKWISKSHPYGWVQWYCDFYKGERSKEDLRQIKRWKSFTGPKGRFRKWLITQIINKKGEYNDYEISPKIRQSLLQWGYELTKKDFNLEKNLR
jgi:hypothetical protein